VGGGNTNIYFMLFNGYKFQKPCQIQSVVNIRERFFSPRKQNAKIYIAVFLKRRCFLLFYNAGDGAIHLTLYRTSYSTKDSTHTHNLHTHTNYHPKCE
jgi:hypothetical protein